METLLLSVDAAAKVLSIGKTKLYAEVNAGNISAQKLGKRTLIKRESINQYIESLQLYPSKKQEV